MQFRNNELVLVNYSKAVTDEDLDTLHKNYGVEFKNELLFRCKSFGKVSKSWYLQSVDWVRLIPENLIHDPIAYAIKLPDDLPREISIYMVNEIYSRANKMPRIFECSGGKFFRIVDLAYEIGISKNKRNNK